MSRLAAPVAVLLLGAGLVGCGGEPGDVDETAERLAAIDGVVDADTEWRKGDSWKLHDEGALVVALGADPDPDGLAAIVGDVLRVTGGVEWCTAVAFEIADEANASAYVGGPSTDALPDGKSAMRTGCGERDVAGVTADALRTVVEADAASGTVVLGEHRRNDLDLTLPEAGAAAAWAATLRKLADVPQTSGVIWRAAGTDFSMESGTIDGATAVLWQRFVADFGDLPGLRVTDRAGSGAYHLTYQAARDAKTATRTLTRRLGPAARRFTAAPGVESLTIAVSDGISEYDAWWGRENKAPGRWHQRS